MSFEEQEKTQQDVPERERDPAADPEPRGNPEVDQEDVDKGREQIEKVVGN